HHIEVFGLTSVYNFCTCCGIIYRNLGMDLFIGTEVVCLISKSPSILIQHSNNQRSDFWKVRSLMVIFVGCSQRAKIGFQPENMTAFGAVFENRKTCFSMG
ncbi:MAG: hypothetical protein ACI317_00035, partial [Floccifex porci]|uniref:hypothetical protein n=1 Tax=Floccifex porci TaxID=2606629 RepID=UPI003F0D9F5E